MVDKEQVVGDVVVVIGLNKDLGIGAIKLPAEWVDREDGGERVSRSRIPLSILFERILWLWRSRLMWHLVYVALRKLLMDVVDGRREVEGLDGLG